MSVFKKRIAVNIKFSKKGCFYTGFWKENKIYSIEMDHSEFVPIYT